ncbi:MAG TPA: hypothetical protein VHO69_19865 [Phototrophicaceae bacterium]|nr:hypothetical protein [Phototrophicaceae bacterium]
MKTNAYILDWTLTDYAEVKQALIDIAFWFELEREDSKHLRVAVPYPRVDEFAALVRRYLNAPCNYVDVQYPDRQCTVLIFKAKKFVITSAEENEQAKIWALAQGLPPEQADWPMSF